jgi:uncharacterized membrane protein HdeD (DUF308 family)
MQHAMMVASIFGPFLFILGFWMLVYQENMMKVLNSMKNSPVSFYLVGAINLFLGLVVVNEYNVWDWTPPLLVTLLGWFLIVRGLLALFVPQSFVKSATENPSWTKLKGIVPLVWGILMFWLVAMAG